EGVRGIVKSDDRFVVWVSPDVDEALDADPDDAEAEA
ncbi:MAG: chemotaxis protein CheW, partial [Halorubrum sp.]